MDPSFWIGVVWQAGLLLLVTHVTVAALFGAALARAAGYPLWLGITLGVLVPVIGPCIAAIVAAVRRRSAGEVLGRPRARRWNGAWLVVTLGATCVALLAPWWSVRLGASPATSVFATGHVLDTIVILTMAVVAIAATIVLAAGRVHLAAALVLAPAGLWVVGVFLIGITTGTLQGALDSVAAIDFTAGDFLRLLGMDPSVLALVAEFGLDADAADMTDAAGTVSVRLDVGWYAMIAASAVLVAWAAWASLVPRQSEGLRPQPRGSDAPAHPTSF